MKKLKKILILTGLSMLIIMSITFIYIFIMAFISPTHTTLVDINSIGEIYLEVFMICISIPIILYSLKNITIQKNETN
jgi:hypothetical protein